MKFRLAIPSILICAFLTSCASVERALIPTVQNTPPDLRRGASQTSVKMKMGRPDWVEEAKDGGETWYYSDVWHDDSSWGDWKVHFNADNKLFGWELIDPPSNQDFNRSAFFLKN